MKSFIWIVGILFVIWFAFSSSDSSAPSSTSDLYGNTDYEVEELITSENWVCTDDCSGHEAGYEWAAENGITDPYDCDGNSDSFIEGCEAYANEYQMELDEEYNEEDSYYEDYYY